MTPGDYADRDQWKPGPARKRGYHPVPLGRRHIITSRHHDPVACYCPIARNHTEDDFYTALSRHAQHDQ